LRGIEGGRSGSGTASIKIEIMVSRLGREISRNGSRVFRGRSSVLRVR
jgi:hypothetical protein